VTVAASAEVSRLSLAVQKALGRANRTCTPGVREIRAWAQAALQGCAAEVTIRFVGEAEGRRLNRDYRGKDYATNVLTFVYAEGGPMPDEGGGTPLAGDLVLSVPVVVREAVEQGKSLQAHYAHLIVHGMLHLQGYDHETEADAEVMEDLEAAILGALGYANPYA
jgi:probable rRNA maturation factor